MSAKKNNPNGWLQTFSGIQMHPLEPDLDTILLPDIAHALAFQCRFGGHCQDFYSVAQHSILVSDLTFQETKDYSLALAGLLHDSTEAYLVDLPRPVKMQIPEYKKIENNLAEVIAERFSVKVSDFEAIKKYDEVALTIEASNLMIPLHPDWYSSGVQKMGATQEQFELFGAILSPHESEKQFLTKFNELWSRKFKKEFTHV